MTFGKLHRIRLNTTQRKSLQFQGHYIQNSTVHNPGVYMITWANCQRNKIVRRHLLSCHPRVYRGTWGTLHERKWQIAWQQPALVNQKASVKGYLRKLSLKIDKLLGSNMLSHHPGVCKGTCTWRNCVKNSEITRGGGGVTYYGPLKPPPRKMGDSLSNKMFFRKEG